MSQDDTSIADVPSVMRFERVQTILESEPALRERLGPKDQPVFKKRNQEKHMFSRGVVAVTLALHKKGIDAHDADRYAVLSVAADVLEDLSKRPATIKSPAKSAPKAAPKPPKKPAVKAPARPKPKVKAKPAPAAKPVEPPVVQAPAPAPAPEPPKAPAPAPVQGAAPEIDPDADANQQAPLFYIYLTVFSLLAPVKNFLELGDNQPGADQRMAKLDSLIEEVYKLRDVAVPLPPNMLPSSLKDGQNTATSSKG